MAATLLTWVDPSFADPSVDHAARSTYDHNAAYAAHYGLDAAIVQPPSVDDLETLVKAGIPVAISVAFAGEAGRYLKTLSISRTQSMWSGWSDWSDWSG